MIKGHGGNIKETAEQFGLDPSQIVDMSSNVNPLGPPEGLAEFLKERMSAIEALPESDAGGIVKAFANRYGVRPEKVLAGNGTTQFIYAIPEVLETRKALVFGPTYSDYADACKMRGTDFSFLMAKDSDDFRHDLDFAEKRIAEADTVFVCNPNNPTGVLVSGDRLKRLRQKFPQVFFIVDESYLPFVPDGESESLVNDDAENLLVLNSMSKIFRIPRLRIGFVVASGRIIERFYRYYLPWSVNSLAQTAVEFLMENGERTGRFVKESQDYLAKERDEFRNALAGGDAIRTFDSKTSFVLAKLTGTTSDEVFDRMAQAKFLVRNCANFAGLSDEYVRISLKTSDINRRAARELLRIAESGGGNRKT